MHNYHHSVFMSKYRVTRLFVKSNQTENVADYLLGSLTFLRRLYNFI